MKMFAIYLDIWIFGCLAEVGIETIFGQKQPVWTCRLFSSKIRQKITGFDIWKGFGDDLEHPNIWLFEHFLDRRHKIVTHFT